MKQWKPTPVLRRRFEFDKKGVPLIAWVVGLVLVASFVEVWQATRVSELTISIDKTSAQLSQAQSRLSDLESRLAACRTRPALAGIASRLGMKPAEPTQIVMIPAAYLAGTDLPESAGSQIAMLGRRVAEFVVPSARARSRR
jgi:CRP-like cAMP-binding protein